MDKNDSKNEYASSKAEVYTMSNTLGELLEHEIAKEMFDQFATGVTDIPFTDDIYGMTITDILTKKPETKPMYEAMIAALNAQERIK